MEKRLRRNQPDFIISEPYGSFLSGSVRAKRLRPFRAGPSAIATFQFGAEDGRFLAWAITLLPRGAERDHLALFVVTAGEGNSQPIGKRPRIRVLLQVHCLLRLAIIRAEGPANGFTGASRRMGDPCSPEMTMRSGSSLSAESLQFCIRARISKIMHTLATIEAGRDWRAAYGSVMMESERVWRSGCSHHPGLHVLLGG